MRIGCPSCNAVYQVPDEQLVEGRVVRCVRCGTDWSPVVAVPVEDGAVGTRAAEAGRAPAMSPDAPAAALPEAAPAESLPEPDPEVPTRRMALDDDPVAAVTEGLPGWVTVLAALAGLAAVAAVVVAVLRRRPPEA